MPPVSITPASPPAGFAENFTALRCRRGLSLRGLGRRAGVSHDSLGAWERGERLPRLPELVAALTALGASPAERLCLITLVPAPRALSHARREEAGRGGWASLAGPLPGGGDMLRAMRLRRGLTQAEAARAAGVSQGRLAEWERSGDWPDAGRLHALCLALGAHAEEVAALTSGFCLYGGAEGDPEGLDLPVWWEHIQRAFRYDHPLRDLRLLALGARLWPHAAADERARPLLMAVYAYQTRRLTYAGRPAEAACYAARTLDLARAGYGGGEQWAWAVIAMGVALRGSGVGGGEAAVRRRGKRAAGFLKTWEGTVRHPDNRAWLQSSLARSLWQAGEVDAAVDLGEKACRLALEAENPFEAPNCRQDLAVLLAAMGRFGPALTALEGARLLADCQEDSQVLHLMLEAECRLGLGQRAEAHERAGEALDLSARPHLSSLCPSAEALARRF